jgi:hypothetical protein
VAENLLLLQVEFLTRCLGAQQAMPFTNTR